MAARRYEISPQYHERVKNSSTQEKKFHISRRPSLLHSRF